MVCAQDRGLLDSFLVEEKESESIGLLKGRVVHAPWGVYDEPLFFTLPEGENVIVAINGEPMEPPLGAISIQKGIIEGRIPLPFGSPVRQVGLLLDVGGMRISSSDFFVPSLELHPESLSGLAGEKYGFYVVTHNCPLRVTCLWDFGDGGVEETEGTSFSHVYAKERVPHPGRGERP